MIKLKCVEVSQVWHMIQSLPLPEGGETPLSTRIVATSRATYNVLLAFTSRMVRGGMM
jgi:hypothetical protein